MSITRRNFLHHSLAAGAATAAAPGGAFAAKTPTRAEQRIPVGVSTYSYWHFLPEKYPIENVIEDAARMGFDGVEILHRQMAEESTAYLNKLKRLAFVNGLALYMLSIHQNFVSPDPAERQKAIDHTKHTMDLASPDGHSRDSPQHGPLEHHCLVRRPDEGRRTGTAHRGLQRG